jgi:hypothetical protein
LGPDTLESPARTTGRGEKVVEALSVAKSGKLKLAKVTTTPAREKKPLPRLDGDGDWVFRQLLLKLAVLFGIWSRS